jgi:hypothetical protein
MTDRKIMDRKYYPFIHAWGKYMMSHDYYIAGQKELAERDNASDRVIYKSQEGEWHTIDKVGNPEAKQFCMDWVAKYAK